MKSIADMTQAELAAFVQTHLAAKGINVVLSGGACVSIYSNERYVSLDIDFVNAYSANRRTIREAMEEIGFIEDGRHFIHPQTKFFMEFPPGPLAVGSEPVKEIDDMPLATGHLRLLSPTECVKDRLIAYYHWNDQQCLYQAVLVAGEIDVDIAEIKRWSANEGMLDEFRAIEDRLRRGRQ